MGSPLGPILADIFVLKLEQTVMKSTKLYVRYVDDILVACNDSQHASRILDFFDRVHPNIRFTMEGGHENMFHFLDLGIKRNSNGRLERHLSGEHLEWVILELP